MKVVQSVMPGVLLIEPEVFCDHRGFFMESWNAAKFQQATGLSPAFVQENHSRSRRGVLRGIHYQLRQPQGKLVRVVSGTVFDVAVDLRRSSPTFGKWVGHELSDERQQLLWIPPGFGHAFLTLSESADVLYKTTDYWLPAGERSVIWNDPDLAIAWPVIEAPELADKDAAALPLNAAELYD